MGMDIGQAVKRLHSGDSVRRAAWEDEDRCINPDEPEDIDLHLTYADLMALDWETHDG
jgi:hypothetical protein